MNVSEPLVVEVERSGLIESVHPVDVAVADGEGRPVAWAGDPDTVAYLRSSAKPIQALACLENGWRPPDAEHLAVACASHNGEDRHIAAVRATLAAAGVAEEALRTPSVLPFLPGPAAGPAPIFHNCSGKHAAMLATASVNAWPLGEYRELDHPIQRTVAALLERLAGRRPRHVGVDGCGVPTFALTLAEAAVTFARLAEHGRRPLDAMAEHPFLVAGTGRLCTAVMTELPGVGVKIGAEGITCGVLRDGGLGFALKARDGTQRGRDAATVFVLGELLGSLPPGLIRYATPAVTGGGLPVGTVRCRGSLRRA
ncbi:MAG: asparaginase [Chloroflexi bacterium]|nr:asparaginase [Chloroflexota bacterium]